jgi:hypothetical protein
MISSLPSFFLPYNFALLLISTDCNWHIFTHRRSYSESAQYIFPLLGGLLVPPAFSLFICFLLFSFVLNQTLLEGLKGLCRTKEKPNPVLVD